MLLGDGYTFNLRFGYLAGRESAGMTYGLGLAGKNWGVDCSFVPSKTLDTVSQATLNYKF